MTTERKARSEARNRLMSLGIGLLFIGSVVQLRAADLVSQRTLKEIRAHPPIPIEMAVPADGVNHAQTREEVLKTFLDAGLVHPSQIETHGAEALFREYQRQQHPLERVQILSFLFYNSALHAFEQGDRAGESGIIAYLRGLKKNVRGAYPRRTLMEITR